MISEPEQIQRFFDIVKTMRTHEKRFARSGKRVNQEGITKAHFLIDSMIAGKRVNAKFQVIPEATQQDIFNGIE